MTAAGGRHTPGEPGVLLRGPSGAVILGSSLLGSAAGASSGQGSESWSRLGGL